MKKVMILALALSIFMLASCEDEQDPVTEEVDQSDMVIFPEHATGKIGDTMPFYDDGRWHIFYLHEQPPSPGFHPWYRMSTTNFYEFEDHGEVIPVVHDLNDPELALGTGSVIKKDDTYHLFYTSHNSRVDPVQSIMHATSDDDMETWDKRPENTFNAKDTIYDEDNFRDPHVVYIPEDQAYWMLITTRAHGRGVIAYYRSTDLVNWEDQGILFDNGSATGTTDSTSNLECPTLVHHQGYWYLVFSEQWPTRVTRYRYSESPYGPWQEPPNDTFDGEGLYAGKVDSDGSRMILTGWVSSDFNREPEFLWGGQLVAHELSANDQGLLDVKPIQEVDEKISREMPLTIDSSNIDTEGDSLDFGRSNYDYVVYDTLTGINKITGRIKLGRSDGRFGIYFGVDGHESSFHYAFDQTNDTIGFYDGSFIDTDQRNPKTSNRFILNDDQSYDFTLIFEEGQTIEGSVVTLYLDGRRALTGRMFNRKEVNFGFYSIDHELTVTNLKRWK
ncbi:MAG: family 43 glycosylhydrolase [Acholeplasmataceae bacterium]